MRRMRSNRRAGYVERYRSARDEHGHALVVRNGRAQARKVTLGAGTVGLNAPRVGGYRPVIGAPPSQRF
jgi:hypothetical protein